MNGQRWIWVALAAAVLVAGCGGVRPEPSLPSIAALQGEPLPESDELKALKEDVARLHEKLAEMERAHVNALVKIGELYSEIEKLRGGGTTGVAAPPEAVSAKQEGTSPPTPQQRKPMDARPDYEEALRLYNAGQYADAAKGFEAFVTNFPDDALADNAQYWLGESYFARKAYLQALEAFRQVEALYPKGNKVPDSLLKIGMAYSNLGEYEKAVTQLEDLIERFPASPLVSRAREEIARVKGQE